MNIFIGYVSLEGHTAKIAEHVAKMAVARGHEVQRVNLADDLEPIDVKAFDRVILAGSVHQRRHPKELEVFLAAEQDALRDVPTLFLSVSLSAAFDEGHEDATDYLIEMKMRTKFEPSEDMLVPGAINVEEYDYFAQQVVQYVVMRGKDYDRSVGYHDFTDYTALDEKVAQFLKA